jgi:dienelactone hydrolase
MNSMAARLLFLLFLSTRVLCQAAPPIPAGQVIDNVLCEKDASQSYALYLPSNYTAEKSWPVIYAFDPLARGKLPVSLFKNAAEKYGYIIVGSNNSRNFALDDSSKAANAIWIDTHARLSLDPRQTYTTGFSGGARIAGLLAANCQPCQIAGVIAQGAGYYDPASPPTTSLVYFLTVGDQDFNWPEVIGVRRERENSGMPYRVRVFAGPHQWAPPALLHEAIEWIHLKAMQSGRRPQDTAFIDDAFRRVRAEAADAEKANDPLAQLNAYRSLVSDFGGLKPVTEYEQKLDALRKSSALKASLNKERSEIDEQQLLTASTSALLGKFAAAGWDDRLSLKRDIRDAFAHLESEAKRASSESRRNLYRRCFNDLWAQGIEAGQSQLVEHHSDIAVNYFQLMAEVSPHEPWPALLSAEAYNASGNKKEALKSIREALRRGLKNPDAIEKDRNLEALRTDPEFQKLVAEMKKN